MKKLAAIFVIMALCLCCISCGTKAEGNDGITINIKNEAAEQLKSIGITYCIGEEALGTLGVEHADGSPLGNDGLAFILTKEDIPDGTDLSKFRMEVSVTDAEGQTYDVCTLAFVPEFGEEYHFLLKSEDGSYSLRMVQNGVEINFPEGEIPEEAGSIDLTGPWHLDEEKNDLTAFQDIFPAYAEFGASMEIKSNGQIDWYIGAEGGSGTYTQEGDALTVNMTGDVSGQPETVTLLVIPYGEAVYLMMDCNDTAVFWAYGDSGELNAAGE